MQASGAKRVSGAEKGKRARCIVGLRIWNGVERGVSERMMGKVFSRRGGSCDRRTKDFGLRGLREGLTEK